MHQVKIKAVVYPTPFQYMHPLKSSPPSEVTWNQVARVQANARLALGNLQLPQIIEIADSLTRSMESFYNDCEFLRWMGQDIPAGTNYYDIFQIGETLTLNDSPFADVEIIEGYCIERMALPYTPAKIYAVFALMRLDEMAERHHYYKTNPKRTIDLEMAGGALCEAAEAMAAAFSVERVKQMKEAVQLAESTAQKKIKRQMAKHAAAGRSKKRDPFKKMVLEKYAAGKWRSPNDASFRIWEDVCANPMSYPAHHLVKTRARGTIYD